MTNEYCYGFHSSVIPETAAVVHDTSGGRWNRAGPRSWRQATTEGPGPRMHESWLLAQSPVRCPIMERVLAERDEKLEAVLTERGDRMPGTDIALAFEDAMTLMRAGWLAWSPKQRSEALASLRETEESELAKTS